MHKISRTLTIIGITITISSCNIGNGNPSTTREGQQTQSQLIYQHNLFTISVRGSDAESNTTTQNIRLMSLSNEQIDIANKIGLENSSQLPLKNISNSYKVINGISGFPHNFYNNDAIADLAPLNQRSFNTSVVFSTAAALSYLYSGYKSTIDISPLDILDAGYELYPNLMSSTGWTGLSNATTLLNILPNIGYYQNYTATNSIYKNIADEFDKSTNNEELTIGQLKALSGFDAQLVAYQQLGGVNGSFTNSFNKLHNNWSVLFNAQNTSNAQLVMNALDNGEVILVDFNIYDAAVNANSIECQNGDVHIVGNLNYQYNLHSNTIDKITASNTSNNTWASASGCLAGGHQAWIVGYATSGDGNTLFVIRNSWGNSGDQGQYYMTDDYLNNSATHAVAISNSNL